MASTFMEVIENQNGYFGEGWQYPLFAIALCALLLLWRRRDMAAVVVYTFIMLIIIYCPVTAFILMKFMGENVYWRMFWLLPLIPVLGVAMTEFLPLVIEVSKRLFAKEDSDKTKRGGIVKVITVLMVLGIYAGLLTGGGNFVYKDGNVTWAKNFEKLPLEVIDVIEALNSDYENSPSGEKKLAAVGTIVPFIRQYDSTITLTYGRSTIQKKDKSGTKGKLYTELTNKKHPDYEFIEKVLKKTDTTYLIVANNMSVSVKEMSKHGYEAIYDNGAYTLLKAAE